MDAYQKVNTYNGLGEKKNVVLLEESHLRINHTTDLMAENLSYIMAKVNIF